MNPTRIIRRSLVAGLAFAEFVAADLVASTAIAAPRCDAPGSLADRRACDVAKQGPDALRRFIHRTQSIYGLYFWDYMSPAEIERHYARQQAQIHVTPEHGARTVLTEAAHAR